MPLQVRPLTRQVRWKRACHCQTTQEHQRHRQLLQQQQQQRCYASAATATVLRSSPASPPHPTSPSVTPIARYPPSQPPSHKPPEFRKSQLHRQYTSLLRSSPVMLLFHHNNLRSGEWLGIRRELAHALRKVDEEQQHATGMDSAAVKLQIVQTGIFAAALRVVEFFRPELQPELPTHHPTDPASATSAQVPDVLATPSDPRFTHGLSRTAWEKARDRKLKHGLEPLLSGPLAVLAFPSVSPPHLAAALSILAPDAAFPAPRRRVNPAYHEPAVQSGLQKLLLLGARVEGRVLDPDGTRWVGGIQGGLDGLRAQLVALLQGVGQRLTLTLEGAGRNLYITLEGRKKMLEDEAKDGAVRESR